MLQEITSLYNEYAETYDKECETDRANYPSPILLSSWMASFLEKDQIRILDLGCGTGQSSLHFFSSNRPFEVIGIDCTPNMLKEASKRPFKHLVCQDIETEWKVEGLFHGIICVGVIEFISNLDHFFDQVSSRLTLGGAFALTVPENSVGEDILAYSAEQVEDKLFSRNFSLINKKTVIGYVSRKEQEIVNYRCLMWKKQ